MNNSINQRDNKKMIKLIDGKDKVFFGKRKSDGAMISMDKPVFDCGWYWGFGYLGNSREHYHLSGYQSVDHFLTLADGSYKSFTEKRNINMYDALITDYDLSEAIKKDLWQFCELVTTIYTLKAIAETHSRGGSHFTTNNCQDILKDNELYKKYTFDLIPKVCQELWNLISN